MTSAIQTQSVVQSHSRRSSKKPSSGKGRRALEILLLSAPAIIMFLSFVILPLILGFFYGFYKWKGFGMPYETGTFVGFQNYITAFKDPTFQRSVINTFIVLVGSLVIQAPLAILFALLLNQKFKGRGLIRTLIFLPYVISEVIVGTGWSLLLQKKGAVNEILASIGIHGPDWLATPKIAMVTLLLIISWKYIGFAVILMLAGMQSIPEELYEAARVDGAGFWQMQWKITLPLLAPTLRIWVFLSMIGSLQLFDLVSIIWGSFISETAGVSTMAIYMVRNGRDSGNYGYGSAIAIIIFIISLAVALTYQKFVLNRDLDGALTEQKKTKKLAAKRAKLAENAQSAVVAGEVK